MKNLPIAIPIVFLVSIAYGKRIGARKELTVSIFHPIQLLQGWLRAQLESRLLGNDEVPRMAVRSTHLTAYLEENAFRQMWMDAGFNETDFENPEIAHKFFELWRNTTGDRLSIREICEGLIQLSTAIVTKEQVKNDKLIQRLNELNEELEVCINSSGFSGFFKSIFCTIKLTFSILVNTLTLPHTPVRRHLNEISKEVDRDVREVLSCPVVSTWIPGSFGEV